MSQELQETGLSKKEALSMSTELRNLKDLETFTSYGGPVTSSEESLSMTAILVKQRSGADSTLK